MAKIKLDNIKDWLERWNEHKKKIFWLLVVVVVLIPAWAFWVYVLGALNEAVVPNEVTLELDKRTRESVKMILQERESAEDIIVRDVFR